MDYIKAYWGKAVHEKGQALSWHPLAYHCLDVAACLDRILTERPHLLKEMARHLALPLDETRRRLILAAALHDLGKFAGNFQRKIPELAAMLQPGKAPCETLDSAAGHGSVGAGLWNAIAGPLTLERLNLLPFAAFSHHLFPAHAGLNRSGGIP